MKIGFSGAGGTGKGTIMEEINKIFPHIYPLKSPVMEITQNIFPNSKNYKDLTLKEYITKQFTVSNIQIQNEILLNNLKKSYIAERSLFDYIPYTWTNNQEYKKEVTEEDIILAEIYEQNILKAIDNNPYDLICFFPVEFEPTEEDLIQNFWKERDHKDRQFTNEFLEIITTNYSKKHNIPLIIMKGSVEDRKNMLLDAITIYK